MTSANFFNGYAADKPTSRVLNPPGGRSNNIFGGYEEETNGKPAVLTPQQEARNNKAHQAGDTNIFSNNAGSQKNYKPSNARSRFIVYKNSYLKK